MPDLLQVMEDGAMKQFLELVPDVREIISHFYHSQYSQCLALMDKIRGDLLLDSMRVAQCSQRLFHFVILFIY